MLTDMTRLDDRDDWIEFLGVASFDIAIGLYKTEPVYPCLAQKVPAPIEVGLTFNQVVYVTRTDLEQLVSDLNGTIHWEIP